MAQGTDVSERSGHGAAHGANIKKDKDGFPVIDVPPRVTGLVGKLGVHPTIVVIVALALIYPAFANSYWMGNVATGLILAIACLGLLVVVGWGREISLAQAGLVGSAVYLSGYAARGDRPDSQNPSQKEPGLSFPFPLAAATGILFAVIVSVIVALISMRLAGVYVIVLTLSLQFLLEASLFTEEKFTGGLSAPSTPVPEFFGSTMNETRLYYFILAVLLISMLFLHRFRHSRFGRSLIMVGSDKAAAAAVGVSPWMYKVAAFAVAGFFAGLAGAVSAPYYGNPPGTNQYVSFNSLFYLSIPILAGFESIMATVGVAVFFNLVPYILLDLKINVYLLGGIGLALGVLAGPRGAGGFMIDAFDPRARAKRKQAKGETPSGGSSAGTKSGPSLGAKPKGAQLGQKKPAAAGSEKK